MIRQAYSIYGEQFVSERGFACMVEIVARLRDKATFAEIPFVLRYDEKRKPSEMKIFSTVRAYFRVIGKVRGWH